MLRPLSPATYLTLTLCFPLTHTISLSFFLISMLPLFLFSGWLVPYFLVFFQWFGIFCFMSAMFLYGLSIAHPSFSHLPFLLPFHSFAYGFLSIFTCLLFSSNLYSYFSHLFFHVTLSLFLSLPFPHPAYFTQFLSNPSSTLFCFFTCFLPPLSTPPSLTALRFLLPHHFITVFLNPSLLLVSFLPQDFSLPPSLSASLYLSHSREECQVFHFLFICLFLCLVFSHTHDISTQHCHFQLRLVVCYVLL